MGFMVEDWPRIVYKQLNFVLLSLFETGFINPVQFRTTNKYSYF